MTDISKKVYRRTIAELEGGTSRGRRIVVGLGPGNNISVREEKCHKALYISASELYKYLEYQDAKRSV